MITDAVFQDFPPVTSETSGKHIYDFIGVRTAVKYKSGWAKHAGAPKRKIRPGLPVHNEHYFDWIATLTAVRRANGTFRMAELGAGWAPWLVRAATASRMCPQITGLELVGIEADPTHYLWMKEHFEENGLDPSEFALIQGAASGLGGMLRFPVVGRPDMDYGASLGAGSISADYIDVRCHTINDILAHFTGPIDFMHIDIQGAEYDLLPRDMHRIKDAVKLIMIGTHLDNERHVELAKLFRDIGWTPEMDFARNAVNATPIGDVPFDDGFLLFSNPAF